MYGAVLAGVIDGAGAEDDAAGEDAEREADDELTVPSMSSMPSTPAEGAAFALDAVALAAGDEASGDALALVSPSTP